MRLERTHQLNVGGNTDFMNMLERERLESKKISKTNAVTSQLDYDIGARNVHIGPSDYVQWLDDRKWAYIRMEGRSFGDVPLNIELKLEVVDSPNSAGIVIDAVRCAKLGLDNGLSGALEWPSAYFMKSPPVQHHDDACRDEVEKFIAKSRQARRRRRPRERTAVRGVAPAVNPLKLCLASPFALAGAHPVAEHVRGVATALAARGHRVTVLAPNSSTRALRSGRRRLRALAAGDHEALIALDGEPLQVAVAPAVPLRQRGRRRGVGIPVAARANVALAVGQGGFDIVHAFEPLLPGVATSALRALARVDGGHVPSRPTGRCTTPSAAGRSSAIGPGSTPCLRHRRRPPSRRP